MRLTVERPPEKKLRRVRRANLWPLGVWRSLVARSVRVGEVPSSNLGTPIGARGHGTPERLPLTQSRPVATRDEILDYAAELLDLDSFPDYGPQGMQVAGADEVTKIVCAVSSSLELFERAAAAGAQLVHRPPRPALGQRAARDRRAACAGGCRRSSTPTSRSPRYHLALDAHPEVGNNALLARELGVDVDGPFAEIGFGGRAADARAARDVPRPRPRADRPRAARLRGRARTTSSASRSSPAAAAALPRRGGRRRATTSSSPASRRSRACTSRGSSGSTSSPPATTRPSGSASRRSPAQLAEHFDLEWEFVELPNPV